MREADVLAAIDQAENGEIPQETLFAGSVMPAAASALTNVLAKMRREGTVRRIRKEDGTTVYVRGEAE